MAAPLSALHMKASDPCKIQESRSTMILPFEKDRIATPVYAAFIDRLKQIYTAMDRAYDRAADPYGFTCDGCADNCCRTRFYHHTVIEPCGRCARLILMNCASCIPIVR